MNQIENFLKTHETQTALDIVVTAFFYEIPDDEEALELVLFIQQIRIFRGATCRYLHDIYSDYNMFGNLNLHVLKL